jgi:hypothetical protein
VSVIRSIDCSFATLQGAKLTIIFHIGVITNVNFAKKAITVALVRTRINKQPPAMDGDGQQFG